MNISVVIITNNEAHIIGSTLKSITDITDDIVIVDSGSADNTIEICRQFGANIIQTNWEGYGKNKNKGISQAKYDWILNLDADEVVSPALKNELVKLSLLNKNEVFKIRFKNFFINKQVRFGEWGNDKHIRLFNRNAIKWNDAAVHENLMLTAAIKTTLLKGYILHYTVHSLEEYEEKTIVYARLNAKKYFEQKKKIKLVKKYFSPLFSFVYNYFIRLGFLDGSKGFTIAKNTARYTYLKYVYLEQMKKNNR